MRSIDPYRFDTTGISKPVGLSNNSAGPPPGDLQARSVTAAISRFGLTASVTRASSFRFSRSAMKSVRSAYIAHFLRDLRGKGERAAAIASAHERRVARRDGIDEVGELALQRLLVFHRH